MHGIEMITLENGDPAVVLPICRTEAEMWAAIEAAGAALKALRVN